MTEKVRIEHALDCSEETFWKLFLDEKFNTELYNGYLKFPLWRIASSQDSEKEMRRVIEVEPYVADLPAAIKKVVGDNIRYREEGRFDKEKRRYHVDVVPARMADKILVKGEQLTEPTADGKCKRVFLAEITVKIFGLGGMMEKRVIADLQRSYDLSAKFTNRYVKENSL